MANLEYVVRPYQTPNTFGQTIIPSTPVRADRATLTWGATVQGTVPVAKAKPAAPSMTYQFQCCGEQLQEQSRQSEEVKIPILFDQNNNPYVTVSRPQTMELKKQTRKNCDSPLEQISYVSQGINEVLGELSDAFQEISDQFGTEDCNTKWKFAT